ncbi:MAG: hypothetical protein K6E84_07320 [Lachnospiraceae bacterium]|nr:hypothetical protein [Lachnospiraceae bacterium]
MDDAKGEMNRISDEELEGIAGGTQKEIDELMEICGGNDDLLGDALRANGVFALLYGGETFQKNHYIDTRASTMKFYSHEAIVEMVRKYMEAQG